MSVHLGPSGRRSVRVEVEVAGSPQEVWDAIATAPAYRPGSSQLSSNSAPMDGRIASYATSAKAWTPTPW